MRLPKLRGGAFSAKVPFAVIHVSDIEKLAQNGHTDISITLLAEKGYIRSKDRVKLLSGGSISTPVTLSVHAASASARSELEKAGGTLNLVA